MAQPPSQLWSPRPLASSLGTEWLLFAGLPQPAVLSRRPRALVSPFRTLIKPE